METNTQTCGDSVSTKKGRIVGNQISVSLQKVRSKRDNAAAKKFDEDANPREGEDVFEAWFREMGWAVEKPRVTR